MAVVGGQQHLVAGAAVPPRGVVGHDPVPQVFRGGHRLRIGQVEGGEGEGLGDVAGVLGGPGAGVVTGVLVRRDQIESLLGGGGFGLAVGDRGTQVGEGVVEGAQARVQPFEARDVLRVARAGVGQDPLEGGVAEPGRSDVVAHEVDLAAGVPVVVPAHPGDETDELLALPGGSGQCLPGDPPGVTRAALEVLVDAQTRRPAHLQGEGGEALFLDEVAEDAFLHGEELVRAVGGLAQPDHLGVADHGAQCPQVGGAAAGFRRPQGLGGALQGPDRGGLPAVRGRRRAGGGSGAGRGGGRRGEQGGGREPGRRREQPPSADRLLVRAHGGRSSVRCSTGQ